MESNGDFKKLYNIITKKVFSVKDRIYQSLESNPLHVSGCYLVLSVFICSRFTYLGVRAVANTNLRIAIIQQETAIQVAKISAKGKIEIAELLVFSKIKEVGKGILGRFIEKMIDDEK